MFVIKQPLQMRHFLQRNPILTHQTAFVPTMGALHNGHLSLVKRAQELSSFVIVSIFVNPTQFNDPADFAKYPKTLETDLELLEKAGVDLVFTPEVADIFENGLENLEHHDLGSMDRLLEGKHRPGHFQGVSQVVFRLLKLVTPHYLVMGSKDYQQCMVVNRLIVKQQLPVELVISDTIREPNGLAMSSRNARLSPAGRQSASAIYKLLFQQMPDWLFNYSVSEIEEMATQELLKAGFEPVDYVSIADPDTLEPLSQISKGEKLVILVAAFLEGVRLIDNRVFTA